MHKIAIQFRGELAVQQLPATCLERDHPNELTEQFPFEIHLLRSDGGAKFLGPLAGCSANHTRRLGSSACRRGIGGPAATDRSHAESVDGNRRRLWHRQSGRREWRLYFFGWIRADELPRFESIWASHALWYERWENV